MGPSEFPAEDWTADPDVMAVLFDEITGLPRTNRDQSCAFCGSSRPRFAHRLDPQRLPFLVYGEGHTLPGFWAVCGRCEELVARGDDAQLLRLMREDVPWEDALLREASLTAFRAADFGAVPILDW